MARRGVLQRESSLVVSVGILQFARSTGSAMVHSSSSHLDVGVRNDSGMCGRNWLVLDQVAPGRWREPMVILCLGIDFDVLLGRYISGSRLEEGYPDGTTVA